jgi:hypothetical protein
MGLDVTAYRNLRRSEHQEENAQYELPCAVRIYMGDFPQNCADFENDVVYEADEAIDGPSIGYMGYGFWRNYLAQLAGYPAETSPSSDVAHAPHAAWVWRNRPVGRFAELINFSDCEGCIGASTAKKLAADFAEFQPSVDLLVDSPENQVFKRIYAEFRTVFEFASNNGAVRFH